VDLFFVLSGFILTVNYAPSSARPLRSFWLLRFFRIYPSYLVGLLLTAVALKVQRSAIDDLVGCGQATALEPEDDI